MKTLFPPIYSFSHLPNDPANVELPNTGTGGAHCWLNKPLAKNTNRFTVSVPVPGMSKKDLSVYTEGNVLIVSAKRQDKLLEHPGARKHRDIMYSFALPSDIDKDRIQAKCRDGLLTINLKKIKNQKHPTIIKVLGQRNDSKDNWRMNTLWNTIKAKLDARKIDPTEAVQHF
jgi:HSP20 family molecular chaperone IbpA